MKTDQPFLGTGWGFPPTFDLDLGEVKMTSGIEDIERSLHILLATKLGERIMVPNYGCNLEELLFEPLNLTVKTYIKELIKTAILYHEQRIDVKSILINSQNEHNGEVLITIDFVIRATNSRGNVVFPFYKNEGSEI